VRQRAAGVRERVASRPGRQYVIELLVVAASYYVVAELGLRLALVGRSVTPLWPPTGLALVAFLAFGRRTWPAIAVAAFAVNAPISPTFATAGVIAVGNTVAPMVAATLLTMVGFRRQLDRLRDAVVIVLLAALVSMTISATIGTLALVVSGAVDSDRFARTWLVWWTGDAMGVLIVAPFLWSLQLWRHRVRDHRRVAEAVAFTMLLLVACAVAFLAGEQFMFVVLPVLGWIAWRFEQRGAAPAALVVSVLATLSTAQEVGPFAGLSLVSRMVTLQSFNATVAFTAIVVASAVSQRERSAEREHRVVETLQRSLLPEALPDLPGITVAARYIPATADVKLGGDWYDIIPLRGDRLAFAVGDVAGHGVPAAAVMGQIRMALRAYALDELAPAEALGRLNRLLRELQPTAMATVWYGHYDPAVNVLSFSSAGHLPPLLIDERNLASYLEERNGPPLGAVENAAYPQVESALEYGAVILLYTDGLVENRSAPIDAGLDRLRVHALEATGDLEELCDHIVATLLATSPVDDVALLAIRPNSFARRELRLKRPASPHTIPEVRRVIRLWLVQNDVSEDEAFDVLVAAGEACSNAVQHAYGLTSGTVEIEVWIAGGELRIEVKDRGTWRARAADAPNRGGGRGLGLMRSLMDGVEIDSGAHGTHVRMRRRLNVPNRAETTPRGSSSLARPGPQGLRPGSPS
jgi:integral membrane sensor domain MASE1/anti-sigma regulatory factor (Ser/Thr protein kinase)